MIIGAGILEHIKSGSNLQIECEYDFGKFSFHGEVRNNKLIENSIKVVRSHERRFNRLSKKLQNEITKEIKDEINEILRHYKTR